jgi:hypothetical protein
MTCAQAMQVPVQAVSQQTPSTQKPDAHSAAMVHAPPAACRGTQAPLLHLLPAAQSVALVQLVLQDVAPQT